MEYVDPTEPCDFDPNCNGEHDWVPLEHQGSGDPLPGARYCMNPGCGAMDVGPQDVRINWKDSPIPVFPAGTRSYRTIRTHNPKV